MLGDMNSAMDKAKHLDMAWTMVWPRWDTFSKSEFSPPLPPNFSKNKRVGNTVIIISIYIIKHAL